MGDKIKYASMPKIYELKNVFDKKIFLFAYFTQYAKRVPMCAKATYLLYLLVWKKFKTVMSIPL